MISNSPLEIGQVLWLNVRYQIDVVSSVKHPMLIAKVEKDYIEIIAIDKTANKMHQLYHDYNFYINSEEPKEKVIFEDSYAQLNTKLTIDKINELKKARKNIYKLSSEKLKQLLEEYSNYQNTHNLDEQRIVHMTKKEIIDLNKDLIEK